MNNQPATTATARPLRHASTGELYRIIKANDTSTAEAAEALNAARDEWNTREEEAARWIETQ